MYLLTYAVEIHKFLSIKCTKEIVIFRKKDLNLKTFLLQFKFMIFFQICLPAAMEQPFTLWIVMLISVLNKTGVIFIYLRNSFSFTGHEFYEFER